MINTQYINLNMTPSGVMPVLYCSQYDIGRPLGMVVYNGGEAVDLDGYTCTIEATRTDGIAITAAVTTDDNIGAFVTTATMTNKVDKYPAKLVLFDSNSRRVASLAFMLCVTLATMDENAESIEEDASLYQQYTGTVQTLIADIRSQLTDLKNQLDGGPYQMPYIKGDDTALAWQHLAITPQMFGAKGDGITDDTAAFQSAINQFGTLFVPSGSYVVNGLVLKEGTKIVGENEFDTIIVTNGFNTRTGNEDISRMMFSDLTFIGDDTGTCLDLSGSTTRPFTGGRYTKLKNLTFKNFTIGILERGCWCVDHDVVRFIQCGTAVKQEGSCNNVVYNHCIITGTDAQTQTGVRIVADGGAENYNVDFLSCAFENLDVAVDVYSCVSLNINNPYVEKVNTFLNATNLLSGKGNGGNFNGIGRLLSLTKTSAAFFANTGVSYDGAYVGLASGNVIAYPQDGTYADLSNIVSSEKVYLNYIDAASLSGCAGNYATASAESSNFNIRYTSSKGTFANPSKRRFDALKVVSGHLTFSEACTVTTGVQVRLTNNGTVIGTAEVQSGSYTAGQTIDMTLDVSVLGNRIMDDLSGLSVASTNSASSNNVNITAILDLLVAEMMTRTL